MLSEMTPQALKAQPDQIVGLYIALSFYCDAALLKACRTSCPDKYRPGLIAAAEAVAEASWFLHELPTHAWARLYLDRAMAAVRAAPPLGNMEALVLADLAARRWLWSQGILPEAVAD